MIHAAIEPDVSKWNAWRPERLVSLLEGVEAPWYVAGGWAIDLFLGSQRRVHEDLEIAVPNSRFEEFLPALQGFEVFVITGPREATPIEVAGDALDETHQTWVREPATGLWRLDVLREPSDGDTWICRRDASVRMPYDRVIDWNDQGIPYGCPEIILLFKAKHAGRARDEGDFADVLDVLQPESRHWLAEALEIVHPGHPWLTDLVGRLG
jgi:hypothetical protein